MLLEFLILNFLHFASTAFFNVFLMDEDSDNFLAIVAVESTENEALAPYEDSPVRVPDPIIVKGSGHVTV